MVFQHDLLAKKYSESCTIAAVSGHVDALSHLFVSGRGRNHRVIPSSSSFLIYNSLENFFGKPSLSSLKEGVIDS
jgi:hypothetical protein